MSKPEHKSDANEAKEDVAKLKSLEEPETEKAVSEEHPVAEEAAELKESEHKVEDAFSKLQEELGELNDRYLRAGAEFENYKKRAERERDTSLKYANEKLLTELLPVMDHLQQAIAAGENGDNEGDQKVMEPMVTGVKMVLKQFNDVFERFGIEVFSAIGQPFDPSRHEAMGQLEDESVDAGTVLQEYQRGYFLNGRLVRPARVIISKKPPKVSD